MRHVSDRLLSQVEALLPEGGAGISTRQAHIAIGMWAQSTIKNALLELVHRGRAEAAGDESLRLYRKPTGGAA